MNDVAAKPLGRKAYGSIGHLPSSRLGSGDHCVTEGQAKICTVKARDKHDAIVVQGKLDGSCVSVALVDGVLYPLGRAGYLASSSRFEQHRLFDRWVWEHEERFRDVLCNGERIVGEWLAQAHGTIYNLANYEPFAAFDIMTDSTRLPYEKFRNRVQGVFLTPPTLHVGGPLPVERAMELHADNCWPCDELEGVVYRVHRKGEVDFLAKWVRSDKVDGKYLPDITGQPAIWNWRPQT